MNKQKLRIKKINKCFFLVISEQMKISHIVRFFLFQNGPGYARAITFEQITLTKAGNPIIIDQFYDAHLTVITHLTQLIL